MKSSLGNREVFAENLKRFMDKENVSRRDLSKALNIPYTTLTTWLKGDSMKDAGINAGDLAMIRKTPEFEDGKIYAVHKNGEQLASLKKVYKSDNHHLMLVACNSAYPPEQVDAQDIYLIGCCVGVYKNL